MTSDDRSIRGHLTGPCCTIIYLLLLAVCVLGTTGCATLFSPARDQPNIVLIVADDQGYADLGAYGGDLSTPHIDSIARAGARFTDGYVTAPVCIPSRCGLLTGRYQHRFNCDRIIYARIPESEKTLAEHLRAQGYSTAMVGKWHLGANPGDRPVDRGFDEFFGFLMGVHLHMPESRSRDALFYELTRQSMGSLYRGNTRIEEPDYLTDAFAREAADFIERHSDQPFFLYLPFSAVHVPLQAPERYLARVPNIGDERRRLLAAMTVALDDAVGRVISALQEHGLEENTLLFYISDNGGHPQYNASRNDPLRGGKGDLYEGGIRVPYLVQWKGVIPPGGVYSEPVISLDIAATALAAADGLFNTRPWLDGTNLLPYLQGMESGSPHRELFWKYFDKEALRRDAWKLVRPGDDAAAELYHLGDDIAERHNQADHYPELLGELQQRFDFLQSLFQGKEKALSQLTE